MPLLGWPSTGRLGRSWAELSRLTVGKRFICSVSILPRSRLHGTDPLGAHLDSFLAYHAEVDRDPNLVNECYGCVKPTIPSSCAKLTIFSLWIAAL